VACPSLRAARKEFWESKDPAIWSKEEKEILLWQSPWAREGFARIEENKTLHRGLREQREAGGPVARHAAWSFARRRDERADR